MVRIFIALILVLSPVSVVHSEVSKMLEPDHHLLQAGTMDASMLFISPDKPSNIQKKTTIAEPAAKVTKAGLEITPEIVELARGLRNDPQLIYEFVRNNIDYNPTFGLTKGATMTYLDGEGNDFDQTTLLIALMTAAGYTASYMYGEIRLTGAQVMNWLGIPDDPNLAFNIFYYGGKDQINVISSGGSIDYVEIEHAWAKVSIDGTDYMFDPSFKEYTYKQGVDLDAALGYVKSTFIARAKDGMTSTSNYLEDMNRTNIRSDLTTYTSNLVAYIETNIPGAGIDDVIGGRRIKIVRNQPFQTTLDYVIEVQEWMPDETMVYFSYYNNLYPTEGNFDVELEAREIYGKRLTLHTTFDGTDYYVHLILEGEEIGVGKYTEDNQFSIWLDHASLTNEGTYGDQYERINLDKDAFYCFVNGWGHTGRKIIEKRRMILEQFLADGLAPDSEEVLGESLNLIGLSWLSETSSVNKISDSVSNAISIRHHDFGWLTQKDTIILDTPMSASSSLPLDGSTWPPPGSFFAKSGLKSAFEWGAIDQMQPISAVSTIKLLDIANMQGDKIFDATYKNYYSDVRPNLLSYTTEQLNTLDNYISQYYRLILPEKGDLQDKNFRGPGFFALYYDESMKTLIMGGLNGGYGTEYGECDPDSAAKGQKDHDNPEDHPKSAEPIDLLTGHYLETSIDLSTGGRQLPFGLEFIRTYNSGSRLQDGPLGLGRDHNWNVKARKASNGFVGLGARSVVDAAPAIAEIYIAADILQDGLLLDRLMISTLAHRWLVDNLIDNVVNIKANGVAYLFAKQPDGTYIPPPGDLTQLEELGDGSFLFTAEHGTKLDFDTQGRLATWQDPNGNTINLTYSGDRLASVSNVHGGTLSIVYNGENRISEVSDVTTRKCIYTYNTDGSLASVTDPEGNTTSYEYDIKGRLTKMFKPSDAINSFVVNTYDVFDRVINQDDPAGDRYSYYYGGDRTEEVLPLGSSQKLYFDRRGNSILSIDPVGNETASEYDGLERHTKTTYPAGNGVEFSYDGVSHYISQISLFPKPGSMEQPREYQFAYESAFNKVSSITDPLGRITKIYYDGNGNPIKYEYPQVDGVVPTYVLTPNSRGQTVSVENPAGVMTSVDYDSITALPASVTLDAGGLSEATIVMQYDAVGNLIRMTDPRSNNYDLQYDNNRQPVKEIAPAPFLNETTYSFDADGRLDGFAKETGDSADPWQTTQINYNMPNAQKAFADPLGRSVTFLNNERGKLWKMTDNAGRITEALYNAAGKAYRLINPLGVVSEEHSFTTNGQRESVTDANANLTTYQYDDFDRLQRIIFADTSFEAYTYDGKSNIIQKEKRSGQRISYQYNARDQLILKTFPDSSTISYEYDSLGRLTSATAGSGAITFVYDSLNRVVSASHPGGKTIGYEYDRAGNKTKIIYPDGYYVTYTYDELNRLSEILEYGSILLAQYTYDSLSRPTLVTYGNGVSEKYSYDASDDVLTIDFNFSDKSVNFTYGYDTVGNLDSFATDDSSFFYSPSAASDVAFTINNLNQYSSVNGTAYSYDADGNLISDGGNTYSYDSEGQLISASTPGHSVNFLYNALNQRIVKEVDGVATSYIYSGIHIMAEYDVHGNLVKRYIYEPGLDSPVVLQNDSGSYYYHKDRIGSVVALSDSSGAIAESYCYSPFGKPDRLSSLGNCLMFTAREFDQETDLYFYRSRYFSPTLGRFLSPDPIGFSGGGLNLYTYVSNNPVNFTDPLGLNPAFPGGEYTQNGLNARLQDMKVENPAAYAEAKFLKDLFLNKYGKAMNATPHPSGNCVNTMDDFRDSEFWSETQNLEYFEVKEIAGGYNGVGEKRVNYLYTVLNLFVGKLKWEYDVPSKSYNHYGIAITTKGGNEAEDILFIYDPVGQAFGMQLDGANREYGSEAIRDPKIWVEEVLPEYYGNAAIWMGDNDLNYLHD